MSLSIQKTDSVSVPEVMAVESTTDGKHHLDHEQARQLAAHYDPNSAEEKRLVRKLDWRLVVCKRRPTFGLLKSKEVAQFMIG